jgi:GGDEF domain-containing protein
MRRIRLSVIGLLVWALLFYMVDWWTPELTFSTMANVLLPATAMAVIAIPSLQQVRISLLLPALVAVLIIGKWIAGSPLAGTGLPVTGLEIGAVVVTALLARSVSGGLTNLEAAVAQITLGQTDERRARSGEVYREVRRARAHRRPLALLAVRYARHSVKAAQERLLREAEEAMAQHYLVASLARMLNESLDDYNIVARSGDHFLIVLPETAAEAAEEMAAHLRQAAQEHAGVDLQIGAACLPQDATTLDGLVEKAVDDMRADAGLAPEPTGSFMLNNVPVTEGNHGHVDRQ